MVNNLSGWISIHRKIQDNWIWQEKPFSKGQAWIDLLMMVNHEDKTILLGNELIEVKRGSRITSIRQLCDKWGWSNTKVKNFLNLLEKDNMLVVKSDSKKTTITVVNYNDYQDTNDSKNDTRTTDKRQPNDSKTTQEHTNNNDNNDNNTLCMYNENLKNVVKLLEKNIGVIPPVLIDEIDEYSNVFNLEMFSEAIKIASNKKKRNVNYVLGILRNWKDNNILTINVLEAFRKEKELERQEKEEKQKSQNKVQYPKAKKTRFHNFDQRTESYSNDDLERIMERKRQEYYDKVKQN